MQMNITMIVSKQWQKKKKMLWFLASPLPSPENKTTAFFKYQSVGKEVSNLTKKKKKKIFDLQGCHSHEQEIVDGRCAGQAAKKW